LPGVPDVALDDLAAEACGDPIVRCDGLLRLARGNACTNGVGVLLCQTCRRRAVLHAVQLLDDREELVLNRLL
jgi:hypothetical protein